MLFLTDSGGDSEDFLPISQTRQNQTQEQFITRGRNKRILSQTYIPANILKKLKDPKIIYDGRWNYGFKAELSGVGEVYLKIPKKSNVTTYSNEAKFLEGREDIIYYRSGVKIRKWIEGSDLSEYKLDAKEEEQLLDDLKNWYQENRTKARRLIRFDWYSCFISDPHYFQILHELRDEPLTISHGDLNRKNIIRSNEGRFIFIDTEWVRLNSIYFDLVALHVEVGIDANLIITKFALEWEKFNNYIYLYKTFVGSWLQSVNLKEASEYYLFGNEERFFIAKNTQTSGLNKANFEKLKQESFFPEIFSEDETGWILKWQQKISWKGSQNQRDLVSKIKLVFARLQELNLKELPTFQAELNRLEAATASTPLADTLAPYIKDIHKIVKRLEGDRQEICLPTLSPRSFYQDGTNLKLLEIDKLVIGHPCLAWASLSELANLGSGFKKEIVNSLLKEFGAMLSAAQVGALYYFILLQVSRGKFINIEWTLPRLIRKVKFALISDNDNK